MRRPIPVIIGNGGKFYVIDHHHLAKSMWLAKGDTAVALEIIGNWSALKGDRFWRAMARNDWLYRYDAMGSGPMNPKRLKQHVKDLDNDIYRSLSWVVRQKYGYVKHPNNAIFAEFNWGRFSAAG